jgi:hypothetical protein
MRNKTRIKILYTLGALFFVLAAVSTYFFLMEEGYLEKVLYFFACVGGVLLAAVLCSLAFYMQGFRVTNTSA